ncbi:General transcription factor II-I repeat domain-containing protein 2 [Eumeta japonica]|uniref:General transcription factor II-I repeat domain-containing protein 2 n=1 Tax=Eumeta variegata TaxID=151549 RepID=A0A4C1VA48_EUMVA|nr:General transcription factor II-I repeat domain-containing protein 2 [Eumeta japonica]
MARFESFSIALEESTDLSDTAQLAIFIRGVDKEFTVTAQHAEELKLLSKQFSKRFRDFKNMEDCFNRIWCMRRSCTPTATYEARDVTKKSDHLKMLSIILPTYRKKFVLQVQEIRGAGLRDDS